MGEFTEYNNGEVVVCDFCNDEGTLSKGGVLIGSYAVCGKCSEKNKYYDKDHENADEIDRIFDKEKTFQQNVLEYRKEAYGTSDAITQIYTWEDLK